MSVNDRVAVIGVDLGCTGDDALLEGLRLLAAEAIARLHLVHVLDPDAIEEPGYGRFESEARALASAPKRIERHARSLCRVHGLDVDPARFTFDARIGDPATTLLQACADCNADLLIVGTHGRTGLHRLLDGSVSEAVVRRAHCPVIVARRKDYTSSGERAAAHA